jgi:adenine-specific DNA-methyltransferase
MENNFLTIDQIAKTLKVTRQTVSKYIVNNELNAIKVNKSYRILDEDFRNFIVANSILNDPAPVYLKKSRNCVLDYYGKSTEYEVLNDTGNGYLMQVESSNRLSYNDLIFGDNLEVLKLLVPELKGQVDLIYIDPPFGTGQDFADINNAHAYSDKLLHSEFLEFIRKRLILLKELLSDKGSIYLHIDKKIGHYVKIIMDEVFGYDNFINDITRIKCNPKNFSRNAFGNYSDMILFYAKKRDHNIWNDVKETASESKIEQLFPKVHPKHGLYTTHPLHAPGETIDGDTGKLWNGLLPPKGRHWRYSREELTRLEMAGLIEWSGTGNPRKIVYAKDHIGVKVQDVWEFKDKGLSYSEYPTQKNIELLKRIILNSSNPGSIVLDCFAGSGTTLIAADKLNRRWIGIDNSPHAINVIKDLFNSENIKYNHFEYIQTIKESFPDIHLTIAR